MYLSFAGITTSLKSKLIHRFANEPVSTNDGLRWNIDAIFEGVMRACALVRTAAPEGIASIGVDGWAVDYVRLDENG